MKKKFELDPFYKGKDFKKEVDPDNGEWKLAEQVTEFNPQEVVIKYYTYEGYEITEDMPSENVSPWLWECFVEGIDQRLIFRIEQPTFDYRYGKGSPMSKVKIYSHILEEA
jgi:hypothetical protein